MFQANAFQPNAFQTEEASIVSIVLNAVNRTNNVHLPTGIDLSYTLGGRSIARMRTIDATSSSTATAYSPDVDYTVDIAHGAVTLFSGNIVWKTVDAIAGPTIGIQTDVEAIDYSAALDQRIVDESYPVSGGWTPKTIIQDIITTYLTAYGITAAAGMPTGSAITADIVIDKLTARAALNRIALLNNWIWRVTPTKVLEAGPIGTFTAAFSLTSSNGKPVGGVSWRKRRTRYGNRITVRFGGERIVTKTWATTGDGSSTSWVVGYEPLLNFSGDIVSQGIVVEAGTLYYPLFATVGGVTWSYNSGTNSVTRSPALGNGVSASWVYATQFPKDVDVEDPSEIAAHGLYELVVEAPDITTNEEAGEFGNALLARNATLPREVTVGTFEGMEYPGTTITLTFPERSLSGDWLITGTRVRSVTNDRLYYEFTCLEGSTTQSTWLEYLSEVFGGQTVPVATTFVGSFSGTFLSSLIQTRATSTLHSIGGTSVWAMTAQGSSGTGTSLGLLVQGGSNTADTAMKVLDYTGTTHYVDVRGDGNLTLTRAIVTSGIIAPAQITTHQNNYNPTGLVNGSVLVLSADAAWNITGIVPPMAINGCRLAINNAGSNTITLNHEDTNSTTTNRFALPGGANYALTADSGVELIYYSSRWRALFKG